MQTQCVARIQASFPKLNEGFYNVLLERVKDLKIPDARLKQAVKHVIDTCKYPTPTIADFIQYDERVKVYTYDQLLKMNDQTPGVAKFYKPVQMFNVDKPWFAHENDVQRYNLEIFKPKTDKND